MSEKQKKKPRKKSTPSPKKWKSADMAPEKRKERIFVRGLDTDGQIMFERSFGYKRWFKDLHPVVRENEIRHKLRIVKILLKRYGQDGKLLHDTFHDYSPETGEYLYGECRFPDNFIARY